MIKQKRLAISKKILVNPFFPELYKVDYTDEDGYEKRSEIYKIPDFKIPVRVYEKEKYEKLNESENMMVLTVNKYIISGFDCPIEKGMVFEYLGCWYEITSVEVKTRYAEVYGYIGELKCL